MNFINLREVTKISAFRKLSRCTEGSAARAEQWFAFKRTTIATSTQKASSTNLRYQVIEGPSHLRRLRLISKRQTRSNRSSKKDRKTTIISMMSLRPYRWLISWNQRVKASSQSSKTTSFSTQWWETHCISPSPTSRSGSQACRTWLIARLVLWYEPPAKISRNKKNNSRNCQ